MRVRCGLIFVGSQAHLFMRTKKFGLVKTKPDHLLERAVKIAHRSSNPSGFKALRSKVSEYISHILLLRVICNVNKNTNKINSLELF